MLKLHATFFSMLHRALDLLGFSSAWLSVYWIRFNTAFFSTEKGIPDFAEHLKYLLPVVSLSYISTFFVGFYQIRRMQNKGRDIIDIFKVSFIATLLTMAFFYYVRSDSPYSRVLVICFGGCVFGFTLITHLLLRTALRYIRSRGYNLRHYAIIGASAKGRKLLKDLRTLPWTGLKCAFFVDNNSDLIGTQIKGIKVVGPVELLPQMLSEDSVDEVYLAVSGNDAQRAYPVLEKLQLSGLRIRVVPDWGKLLSLSNFETIEVGSQVLFSASDSPLSGYNIAFKRFFDIIASAILIFATLIPMVVIAIAIKVSSRGTIFYKHKRVGLENKTFNILKFRTMKISGSDNPAWTVEKDDRRTRLGIFLRRTSLDELPQLFNVLKGDMSMVGPRPEQNYFVKEFSEEFRRYLLRHKVKTGLTGWAQVNGLRGNTSLRKRLAYDLYYVKNWSFMLDFWILLRTPLEVIRGKNAY